MQNLYISVDCLGCWLSRVSKDCHPNQTKELANLLARELNQHQSTKLNSKPQLDHYFRHISNSSLHYSVFHQPKEKRAKTFENYQRKQNTQMKMIVEYSHWKMYLKLCMLFVVDRPSVEWIEQLHFRPMNQNTKNWIYTNQKLHSDSLTSHPNNCPRL